MKNERVRKCNEPVGKRNQEKRTGGKQNQATKTKEITAKKKGGHEKVSRKRRRI